MEIIENQRFGEERALYGTTGALVKNCIFDGAEDGESALKECADITAEGCTFALRYPFWHNDNLKIKGCEMKSTCRAPLWYSTNIEISDTLLHGIKALRECAGVTLDNCNVVSPEFGWFSSGITARGVIAEGEYLMMRASGLDFKDFSLKGKYSFQYVENATFDSCIFDTKDAFWHARRVLVKNSVVKGEYLAWYSEGVTFENCKIIGTQPFCYCKGLTLINCEMQDCDLAFEKSDVRAEVTTNILSIKNPASGYIMAPSVGEIIRDDERSLCKIKIG